MAQSRTLRENLTFRMAGTPAAWAAAAVKGNFVQLGGVGREAILVVACNVTLSANMLFDIYEAKDSTGTGAKKITTNVQRQFVDGTDEGRVGLITIHDYDLDTGYQFVGVEVTPGASNNFAGIWVIGNDYENPAVNTTAAGVAFNVDE